MPRQTQSEDDRRFMARIQRMTHNTNAAPYAPNGDPGKLRRAARRATKIACKGHRQYWRSGY